MKKLLVGWLALGALVLVHAEEPAWQTDLPKAVAQARTEKKLVLLEFTGSDWCPPCKALRKNVLNSSDFAAYARTNLVLVEIDFPKHKQQSDAEKQANETLAKKFAVEGFPTVILLDVDGRQRLKQVGYDDSSAKDFVARLAAAVKKK